MRTDPTVEKRQEGISFLLIDMKSPGVTVRPLILMDGGHAVNEVFFDDVQVPAENLVHKEGKGWTVAKYLLGYERMNTGRIGESKRELRKLKEFASSKMQRCEVSRPPDPRRSGADGARDHQPALPRPHAPHRPAAGRRRVDAQDPRHRDPAGAHRAAMQAADPAAQETQALERRYLDMRKTTIYAGSNEIQRNIIAKMTLGL